MREGQQRIVLGLLGGGQGARREQQQEEEEEEDYDFDGDSFSGTDSSFSSEATEDDSPRVSAGLDFDFDPEDPDDLDGEDLRDAGEVLDVRTLFKHSVRYTRALGDGNRIVYEYADCPPELKVMHVINKSDAEQSFDIIFYIPSGAAGPNFGGGAVDGAGPAAGEGIYVLSRSAIDLANNVIARGTAVRPMKDDSIREAMRGKGVNLPPALLTWLRSVKLVHQKATFSQAWSVDEFRAFLVRRFPAGVGNLRVQKFLGRLPGQ